MEKKIVFLALAAIVFAAKGPVLSTPYYWDETMWAGFAHNLARMPLWSVVPGLHAPTEFGGRPPGLFLSAAALFKVFGPSIWLAHLFIACFALAGCYFTYLLGRHLHGPAAGVFAALFLLFDGLYFAQSAMFLADLPATALGVASVYFALRRRLLPYLLCSLYLLLLKETALAIVAALVAYILVSEWSQDPRAALRRASVHALPLVVITAYYGWQKATSGKFFVNYASGFDPFQLSVAAALGQLPFVAWSLFVMQGRWVFSALIVAGLVRWATERPLRPRKEWLLFLFLLLGSGFSFVFLYFLPRYVLPWAPYFYLLAAWSLTQLAPGRRGFLLAGVPLVVYSVVGLARPRLVGNGEWNLSYLTVVEVQREMCERIEKEFPDARVLTTWPLTSYLRRSELGWVARPVRVVDLRAGEDALRDKQVDLVLSGFPADEPRALEVLTLAAGLRAIEQIDRGGARAVLYAARGGEPCR